MFLYISILSIKTKEQKQLYIYIIEEIHKEIITQTLKQNQEEEEQKIET